MPSKNSNFVTTFNFQFGLNSGQKYLVSIAFFSVKNSKGFECDQLDILNLEVNYDRRVSQFEIKFATLSLTTQEHITMTLNIS